MTRLVCPVKQWPERSSTEDGGGDLELDACGGLGVVKGLRKDGDGFLSLRAGPDTSYAELGRLKNGDEVILCDYKASWHGVVLFIPGLCEDLSSPLPAMVPYEGPCQSGWVHENFVEQTAG